MDELYLDESSLEAGVRPKGLAGSIPVRSVRGLARHGLAGQGEV